MLDGEKNRFVIGKFALIYPSELKKVSLETAKEWLIQSLVWKDAYHGGAINGNGCKRLLGKIDLLLQICTSGPFPAMDGLQFIPTLRAFKNVVDSCFGYTLRDNWQENITIFKREYLSLNIPVTPKVHAVLYHVPEFCLRHDRGLGIFSEQASESVHSNFKITWDKFKVNEINPNFGACLLRAVSVYNSEHL